MAARADGGQRNRMTSPEFFPAVGALGVLTGIVVAYFKYSFDSLSKRQTQYRLAKEFLADLHSDAGMKSIQLEFGFHALGGTSGRPASEIKHVLELAERNPGILNTHARAALHRVRFNEHLQYFEWGGSFTRRWVRSFFEVVLVVWYIVGNLGGWFLIAHLLETGSQPDSLEFWFAVFLIVMYFGVTSVGALLYFFRIGFAVSLIQSSNGEITRPTPIRSWWRSRRKVNVVQAAKAVEARSKRSNSQ
jgi:hypothetical protein